MKRWLIRLHGFDEHIVEAPTKGAARWRTYCSAREAGYFVSGGFHDFLMNISFVREVRS